MLAEESLCLDCIGVDGSERAYIAYRLYKELSIPVLLIVSSTKEAEKLIDELSFFSGACKPPVIYFPPYNILPFKTVSYHAETTARRIRALYRLTEQSIPPIVITTAGALMQRVIPRKEIIQYAELVMVGEELDRESLIEKLLAGGYSKETITEEPGDFSVRGGILDIFSPLYPNPLRVEFTGDFVDSIRFFSANTQRTVKKIQEAVILPAKEPIVKPETFSDIAARVRARAAALEMPVSKVREIVEKIKTERTFPGFESLLPLVYPEPDTLFDYLPQDSIFIEIGAEELRKAAQELQVQIDRNYREAMDTSRLCVETDALYLRWSEVDRILQENKRIVFKTFHETGAGFQVEPGPSVFRFSVADNSGLRMTLQSAHGREKLLHPLAHWINDNLRAGYQPVLVCGGENQAHRIEALLAPYGIRPLVVGDFPDLQNTRQEGVMRPLLCLGHIASGFVWPSERLAIVTEDEIFGTKHHRRMATKATPRDAFLAYEDLKQGDFIVHDDHGIGRYEGLVKLKLNGSTNDFFLIVYRDDDKLYLPVDRMGIVHKYMGVEGVVPVLDKLGGKSWAQVKAKVRRSAEKIAGELLKIYASRKVMQGFSFGDTDEFFKDFEAGFSFEETQDQFKAIGEVIHDMQKTVPMDRLVCGDVGYGKTEVALRASFLAVSSGKQVAVLVPTTVLAEQHYATFSARFERYPVNLGCLSRFRSPKQQRQIIEDLKAGKLDIVIGTHRLLQKDVAFKDLGLLIIDEEQRFGVKHKERLKKFRATVDVLALTATPIPRTLYMSLVGIRDISVISTPPEYRKAIVTYVCRFDEAVIASAVQNELAHGGQIFFVHNNIQTIEKMGRYLNKLVPEVRLEIAHGQMDETQLERVMMLFLNRKIDMLVCTTIIEAGLDIPSANTILINRADKMGLAQIYQLRGRVGRSGEQAYAYLFIPDESGIGKNAQKRLKVLMEYSDLGSGFQIAMSDLRIRGGGTLLGASQSGHIASVGYDLFLRLMETTISELKGEHIPERLDPEINLPVSAYIPENYMPEIDQRLSVYRRLAKMTDLKEIGILRSELVDRFGSLPKEVNHLLYKIMIKILSRQSGIQRIDLKGQSLSLFLSKEHVKNPSGILSMIESQPDRFELFQNDRVTVRLSSQNSSGLLRECRNFLNEILSHVSF